MNWKRLFAWWPFGCRHETAKPTAKAVEPQAVTPPANVSEFFGESMPSGDVQRIVFPGGLVFDREEFKRYRAEHPEYCQPPQAKFKITAHPSADGLGAVGISLHGAPDPGPKAILDELLKEDGEDAKR